VLRADSGFLRLFVFASVCGMCEYEFRMNIIKSKSRVKLPRGLWVGKLRKPARMWADPDVPEYFDSYYFRICLPGKPQMLRSAETGVKSEAIERGKMALEAVGSDKWSELRAALDGHRVRRSGVTLGEFLVAFEKVARARKLNEFRRNISSARLVAAVSFGIIDPFAKVRMDTDGGRLRKQVDALDFYDVFSTSTAMEYARKMQGGEVINLDKKLPALVNGTINSTLGNAGVVLSERSRMMEIEALRVDWLKVEGFRCFRLPKPARVVGDDLPTPGQFQEMMVAWEGLADEDLGLCNELLRLLALRSGELVMARESWLHEDAGQVFLWVKNRLDENFSCKSTNEALLPLNPALVARLRARCAEGRAAGMVNPFLILPMVPGADDLGEERKERREMVRIRHNEWIKGFIGEVRSRKGNHRLRGYCATALYVAELADHGSYERAAHAVMKYLRHSKEATSLLHYIEQKPELLRMMTDDMLRRGRVG